MKRRKMEKKRSKCDCECEWMHGCECGEIWRDNLENNGATAPIASYRNE